MINHGNAPLAVRIGIRIQSACDRIRDLATRDRDRTIIIMLAATSSFLFVALLCQRYGMPLPNTCQ